MEELLSYLLLLVPLLVFLFKLKREEDAHPILSLYMLSGTLAALLKLAFRMERTLGLDPYSFPSLHAALSFSLFFSVPNLLTFLYAAFVSFLRVKGGFHSLLDIVGGFFVSLVAWLVYKLLRKKIGNEIDRKSLHMGIVILSGYIGLFTNQLFLALLLFIAALLVYFLRNITLIREVFYYYARSEKDIAPLTLSFSLLMASFLNVMPLVSFIIGLVDGLAALIGKIWGKHRIVGGKTLEGFIGGLIGSLLVIFLLRGYYPPPLLLSTSLIAPLVELIPFLDDNILLGITTVVISFIWKVLPV